MAELTRDILVDASPQTIWPFLVEREQHLQWLGTEVDIDPTPGGHYRVLVGGQHPSVGEYLEVVPNERITFTFGWDIEGHPIPAGTTTIEIALVPEGDRTRVVLTHRGLPDDAIADHSGGWEHYLARLGTRLAGGDPGPDVQGSDEQGSDAS